jgi:predicted RNase H-like HicB family nuclease
MSNNMAVKLVRVDAFWDSEGEVWVATSEDLPGLVTEASSNEVLLEKLKVMIPELLELNNSFSLVNPLGIDLDLISRRSERISVPC